MTPSRRARRWLLLASLLTTAACSDAADSPLLPGGNPQWAVAIEGVERAVPRDMAVRGDGSTVVVGRLAEQITDPLDDDPVVNPVTPPFVASFDGEGGAAWQVQFATTGPSSADHVAVASDGASVVGGDYGFDIDFGDGPITTPSVGEPFVVKMSAGGQPQLTQTMPGESVRRGPTVTLLDDDSMLISLVARDTIALPGETVDVGPSYKLLIASLDEENGNTSWWRMIDDGSTSPSDSMKAAPTSNGDIVLCWTSVSESTLR